MITKDDILKKQAEFKTGMRCWFKNISLYHDKEHHSYQLLLDNKPLKSPRKRIIIFECKTIAGAIHKEWKDAQKKGMIYIDSMYYTRLAYGLTDLTKTDLTEDDGNKDRSKNGNKGRASSNISAQKKELIDHLVGFIEKDTILYWQQDAPDLYQRQITQWKKAIDQWLDWFELTAQDPEDLIKPSLSLFEVPFIHQDIGPALSCRLEKLELQTLYLLQLLVNNTGSLILSILFIAQKTGIDAFIRDCFLEELVQQEKWGSDAIITALRDEKTSEIKAIADFIECL